MNPIVKITTKHVVAFPHRYRKVDYRSALPVYVGYPGGHDSLRRWAFICPECEDKTPVVALRSDWMAKVGNTRKCAKDALHYHLINEHGAPG